MDNLKNLFPKDLYHSYILEGNPSVLPFTLLQLLEERGDVVPNSSDVLLQIYDSFAISDSPIIKRWHSECGVTKGKKVCIVGTKFINREAERSLLKILEEPKANTHLFFIIPNASVLLDTIRSRVHIIKVEDDSSDDLINDAKKFLKATAKDRIDIVAGIIEKNKKNENSGLLRFQAINLINNLEVIYHKKLKDDFKDKNVQFVLDELRKGREFLNIPGSSAKMILEHVALVI